MINEYKHKKLTWVDLENPTSDEVRKVMKKYKIHPLVGNELLSPTLRPRVDVYPNLIYMILHFPVFSRKLKDNKPDQEIDFVLGKNFLITTHYQTVDPLYEFSKVFEVNSILDKSNIGDHAGFLFYYLIKNLYKNLDNELEYIYEILEKIEAKIFSGKEKDMVFELSETNHYLLNFRQAIKPHGEILKSLEFAGEHFFGKKFTYYLRAITGEYYKIASHLENHKETLVDLRETNDSLLSTKTNEIVKILTIISFTALPLTLIAGIFGMNSQNMPIVGTKGDFWTILLLMMIITISTFSYFKYKKWL